MGPLPDLTPIFVLAIIGALAVVVGVPALLVWLVSHLAWVP